MRGLSIADQQTVELAAALSHRARVLLMDEPTAALTPAEVGELFRIMGDLKKSGTAIVSCCGRGESFGALRMRLSNRP